VEFHEFFVEEKFWFVVAANTRTQRHDKSKALRNNKRHEPNFLSKVNRLRWRTGQVHSKPHQNSKVQEDAPKVTLDLRLTLSFLLGVITFFDLLSEYLEGHVVIVVVSAVVLEALALSPGFKPFLQIIDFVVSINSKPLFFKFIVNFILFLLFEDFFLVQVCIVLFGSWRR